MYGNPKLKRTLIDNADLRWEWFPEASEVVAVTGFYKRLRDPIEQVIVPTSQLARSFANAHLANNLGIELEARKSLGFMHDLFKNAYIATNATLVRSRVELSKVQALAQTNRIRPLQGQSNYLVNVALGYQDAANSAQVSYNVFGKRINQVGAVGMPDIYEQPFDALEVTASRKINDRWEIKATAENLLDEASVYKQGDALVQRSYNGVTATLGLGYRL